MTEIRPATADDAAALAELRWEFRAGREDPAEEHQAFVARCGEWMQAALRGSTWRAWVAVENGRLLGQIWLGTIPKIPNPVAEREQHGYVSNVYVTPAARGGTGTRLLDAALAYAKAERVDRVVLWPSPLSTTLYRRRGFTPSGDVMELKCR
jgi:ribosomal protein S18 acetylase RimI-like enzyme